MRDFYNNKNSLRISLNPTISYVIICDIRSCQIRMNGPQKCVETVTLVQGLSMIINWLSLVKHGYHHHNEWVTETHGLSSTSTNPGLSLRKHHNHRCINKRGKKRRTKYLFFNKLTLELVGVPEALTVDLHAGAVALSHVTQTLVLQLGDLWDLVCTAETDTERLLDLDNHRPCVCVLSSQLQTDRHRGRSGWSLSEHLDEEMLMLQHRSSQSVHLTLQH